MSEVVSIVDAILFGYSSWPVEPCRVNQKRNKEVGELACHLRKGWGNFYSQQMTRVLQRLLMQHGLVLDLPLG
jgi:hypothetical protein